MKIDEFLEACKHGNLNKIKMILRDSTEFIDIHYDNEKPFKIACKYGQIKVIEFLYELGLDLDNPIFIHVDKEYGFRAAAKYGHIDVLNWIYETSKDLGTQINIHAGKEEAFLEACQI